MWNNDSKPWLQNRYTSEKESWSTTVKTFLSQTSFTSISQTNSSFHALLPLLHLPSYSSHLYTFIVKDILFVRNLYPMVRLNGFARETCQKIGLNLESNLTNHKSAGATDHWPGTCFRKSSHTSMNRNIRWGWKFMGVYVYDNSWFFGYFTILLLFLLLLSLYCTFYSYPLSQ